MARKRDDRFDFVTKDDLIRLACDMRDAQNRFYREGRRSEDYALARRLEGQFDAARKAYDRGINVAPLPGFTVGEVGKP